MSRQGFLVICVLALSAFVYFKKNENSPSEPGSPAAAVTPGSTAQAAAVAVPYKKGRVLVGVNAAREPESLVLRLDAAYGLPQLAAAKARAIREGKPLGFVMVWGQFFGSAPVDSRGEGSAAGMAHFYRAFRNSVVLVYVRHETELGAVPAAVKKGFNGPDEGGFAPNMAVTDATASEFIVEIPLGGGKSNGAVRDQVFTAGAQKVEQWLAAHSAPVAGNPSGR